MRRIHRTLGCAAVAACALVIAACGGNDDDAESNLPGPMPTTLTPEQTQAPNLPTVDGYLLSASTEQVVLLTADGEQTFIVDEQDAPALGIEHMQSHAGVNTLGFRVYYDEQGDRRLIKYGERSRRRRSGAPNERVPPVKHDPMITLAHAGHWAINLIYILPLVIVLSVLGWQKLRENRRDPDGAADDHAATRATENSDD